MFPSPIQTRTVRRRIIYAVALPVTIVLWLIPLLAVAATAVRPIEDILRGNILGWPSRFELFENIRTVLTDSPFVPFLWNTVKVTVPTACLTVFLACMAAYALVRFRSSWSPVILMIFIAGNFIPFPILFFPVRSIAVNTGLYDTSTGLILFHCAFHGSKACQNHVFSFTSFYHWSDRQSQHFCCWSLRSFGTTTSGRRC